MSKIAGMDHQPLAANDHLSGVAENEEKPSSRASGRCAAGERLLTGRRPIPGRVEQESSNSPRRLLTVREIQSEDVGRLWWSGVGLTVVYLIGGGAWFMLSEQWSFTDTVYFVVMSLLTIGYGDITVENIERDFLIDCLLICWGLVTLGVWVEYASQTHLSIRSGRAAKREPTYVPEFDAKPLIRKLECGLYMRLFWVCFVIFVGSLIFMAGESTSMAMSVYWAVVTSSTIGYGDVVPTSYGMKWFTVVYSIVSTLAMVEALRFLGAFPFRFWRLKAESQVFEQFSKPEAAEGRASITATAQMAVAKMLDDSRESHQAPISRAQFTLSMLLMLGRISDEDYQQSSHFFDRLGLDAAETRYSARTGTSAAGGGEGLPSQGGDTDV